MLSLESLRVSKDKAVDGLRVTWDVVYVPLDHAMRIAYELKADGEDKGIFHLWATNLWVHGTAVARPYVQNVLEFDANTQVRTIKGFLYDGKWRQDDKGQKYRAVIAGVCRIGAGMQDFFYSRDYEFSGKP